MHHRSTTRLLPFLIVTLTGATAFAAPPEPAPAGATPEAAPEAPSKDEETTAPPPDAPRGSEKGAEDASLEALRAEKERLELEDALERRRQERALAALESETARLTAERKAAEQRLALEAAQRKLSLSEIEGDRDLVEARREARKRVATDVAYPAQPFRDGVLQISDRRISLNGPITMETADEVAQRLHFFNNQSAEHPIFIVIDYSPGGSVMSGYRILKAMEASQAPVHVVVKSFAASMAAVIATRAEHSYAYPNAILLHHQISGASMGNLRQHEERLAEAREWSHRLLGPVHRKMGITHDQLVDQMYAHDSNGDWKEFADEAVRLKWIDHVVEDVRETGVVELEHDASKSSKSRGERKDGDTTSVTLPRLLPSDHWFMYNPDDYYQLED